MTASPAIQVALLGYGLAGRVFHQPLIEASPGFHIRSICSSRTADIAALAPNARLCSDPVEAMSYQDVSLVVIATPSCTHFELAKQALVAGKHVVIDKPVATQLDQVIELIQLAEKVERRLFAFHNRRWDSDFLSVALAIRQGAIGRVTHFESHFDRFRPEVRPRWREDGSNGSGVWLDLGPHLIDQALMLFGLPDAISANITALREGSQSDDWAHVVLEYPAQRVILHASLNSPAGNSGGGPRFIVHGTEGTIVKRALDPQEQQLAAGLRPGDSDWGLDTDRLELWLPDGRMEYGQSVRGCQERFYTLVARTLQGATADDGRSPALPTTRDLQQIYTTLFAAVEASRQQRSIPAVRSQGREQIYGH